MISSDLTKSSVELVYIMKGFTCCKEDGIGSMLSYFLFSEMFWNEQSTECWSSFSIMVSYMAHDFHTCFYNWWCSSLGLFFYSWCCSNLRLFLQQVDCYEVRKAQNFLFQTGHIFFFSLFWGKSFFLQTCPFFPLPFFFSTWASTIRIRTHNVSPIMPLQEPTVNNSSKETPSFRFNQTLSNSF